MNDLALLALAGLAAGFALGVLHFATLSRVTDMLLSGPVLLPMVLQLARFGVLGAAMYGLALLGAVPLIAAAIGITLARVVIVRRTKGTA